MVPAPTLVIPKRVMDPKENARRGDVKYFEEVEVDVLQDTKSRNGNSVLAVAACCGQLECCKVIYKRCPQLLYKVNNYLSTALHEAVWNGLHHEVKFLLDAAAAAEAEMQVLDTVEDIESGGKQEVVCKLLMKVDFKGQTALHKAAIRDRVNSAKLLLDADPSNDLLRAEDNENETAMHIAVKGHRYDMVKLLLDRDPAYAYSPNKFGLTPHLIALEESSTGDITTVEIRKLLFRRQPAECKKPIGESGWTMLHHATSRGNVTAIEDILQLSPDCAKLTDNEGQNFIHLAADLELASFIRSILRMKEVTKKILNQQDKNGNTPFHIATSKSNSDLGLSMVYEPRVEKFIQNNEGKTPVDMITFDYDKIRARVYGRTDGLDEKALKDRSDFDLLVGALISTVSFTAGITVPGGFFSDGPNQGSAVLYKEKSFEIFVLSNTTALALSLYAVFCHFCARRLTEGESMIYQLKIATYCTFGAIFAMMIAFITGSCAVLVVSGWLAISVCVICCCFFGFASCAMWRMLREQRRKASQYAAKCSEDEDEENSSKNER